MVAGLPPVSSPPAPLALGLAPQQRCRPGLAFPVTVCCRSMFTFISKLFMLLLNDVFTLHAHFAHALVDCFTSVSNADTSKHT